MNNYLLKVQYDGTGYAGWQIQENCITIQQRITEAVGVLLKEKVTVTGSGRTDTGVHALGQMANFRTEKEINIYWFLNSLNALLPKDISVLEMESVPEEFNARFDAKRRSYIYLITRFKSPFYERFSSRYRGKIDIQELNALSSNLLGSHDFTSFSKKRSETKNKNCIIYNAHWKETKGFVIFYIEADRFLHGMVRTITGTMLNAVKTGRGADYVVDILNQLDRVAAGEAVPAKGLFLYKVKYL